jgi:hypothetical protein
MSSSSSSSSSSNAADLSAFIRHNLQGLAHHATPDSKEKAQVAMVTPPSKTPYKNYYELVNEPAVRESKRASDLYRMSMAVRDSKYDDAMFTLREQHRIARDRAEEYATDLCRVFQLANEDPQGELLSVGDKSTLRCDNDFMRMLLDIASFNTIKETLSQIRRIRCDPEIQVMVSEHKTVYLRTKVNLDALKQELCMGVIRAEASNKRMHTRMLAFVDEVCEHLWAECNDPLITEPESDATGGDELPPLAPLADSAPSAT